jgi:hypothetical protein
MSRAITWISKFDLSVHAAVAQTPEDRALVEMLVADFTAKLKRGVKPDRLIHDPLQVNAQNEVEDGRHRLLAALRIDKLVELPCDVTDGSDAETLVCEKLLQRRHYTKSARAYALRHMAAKAAQAGKEASAKMGADARWKNAMPIESARQEITLQSLADKSLLSVDLLQQAVKLERDYMSKADKLITDWLNLNPDDADAWLIFRDANAMLEMPWSAWRSQALAMRGETDDAKSHNIIPRHFREIEEDKIFNGLIDPSGEDDDRRSYSLGAALKAMGSYFATAGQKRPDTTPENPALHLTLINKVGSFSRTMWANWDEIEAPARLEVLQNLTLSISGGTDAAGRIHKPWPADVRQALLVALNPKKASTNA